MAEPRRPPGAVARGLLLGTSLVAFAWAAEWLAAADILSERWIDGTVAGHGIAGYAAFFAVGTLATALGLPRQLVAFLGGYAFGAIVGTELALLATSLGCAATFAYARLLARSMIARRYADRVRRLDGFLNAAPFRMALIVRLLPVGSNLLTNLAAGVTRVRFAPFLAGSAVGYLPQTLAFALAGGGLHVAPVLNIVLAAALFVVSATIGLRMYRLRRSGRAPGPDLDPALADAPPGDAARSA